MPRKSSESSTQHCSSLIAFKYSHFYQAFQSIQNAAAQTIIDFYVQICLFLCEWLLQLTIHIFHSKVDAEFFSERQNASSSTCTLWVTVSMSAICRLAFLYTLHCVAPLIGMFGVGLRVRIAAYFFFWMWGRFYTFLHVWSLLRVCMQVWNPARSEVIYCLV